MFNLVKTKKNKKFSSKKMNTRQTKKLYGKTNKELCKKYKNKSVRTTPKNWAYNKCIKRNNWEMCKKLPPQGWNMYKYFCD
jgi:hypothetical protein